MGGLISALGCWNHNNNTPDSKLPKASSVSTADVMQL